MLLNDEFEDGVDESPIPSNHSVHKPWEIEGGENVLDHNEFYDEDEDTIPEDEDDDL
ncbi:hypothetical protein IT400_03365 [Candidatus Nomurabacteria bacterium]|nr:hypothetical protein [Candidatus Nomurabacteria bacterium]